MAKAIQVANVVFSQFQNSKTDLQISIPSNNELTIGYSANIDNNAIKRAIAVAKQTKLYANIQCRQNQVSIFLQTKNKSDNFDSYEVMCILNILGGSNV